MTTTARSDQSVCQTNKAKLRSAAINQKLNNMEQRFERKTLLIVRGATGEHQNNMSEQTIKKW